MPDVTLTTLNKLKQSGEKIVCLTAYDATFAHVESEAGVEVMLIGDSLGMVLQGHDSTLPVSVDDMAYHTAAVKRGNKGALIMADLPFMAYATLEQALSNSTTLMQAGAHMVKLEGGRWLADSIEVLSRNGIPVCAHMGLTPQTVNVLGGFKVQGRDEAQARAMIEDAKALEAAVEEVVEDLGATKLKDIGRCMSALKERYPGKIESGPAGKVMRKALTANKEAAK